MTRKGKTESPARLKIEADWESAVGRALTKNPPAGGWPERSKRAYKKRAKKSLKKSG